MALDYIWKKLYFRMSQSDGLPLEPQWDCGCGSSAGIFFKQSKGTTNRVGIGLSYRPAMLYTGCRNRFLGIDSWAP